MAGNRRLRPSSTGTVYDEAIIGKRIEELRRVRGLSSSAVYAVMGWNKGEYSRKTRGETPIWAAEYAKLHAILDGWPGFPFVDEEQGRLLQLLKERRPEVLRLLATAARERRGSKES